MDRFRTTLCALVAACFLSGCGSLGNPSGYLRNFTFNPEIQIGDPERHKNPDLRSRGTNIQKERHQAYLRVQTIIKNNYSFFTDPADATIPQGLEHAVNQYLSGFHSSQRQRVFGRLVINPADKTPNGEQEVNQQLSLVHYLNAKIAFLQEKPVSIHIENSKKASEYLYDQKLKKTLAAHLAYLELHTAIKELSAVPTAQTIRQNYLSYAGASHDLMDNFEPLREVISKLQVIRNSLGAHYAGVLTPEKIKQSCPSVIAAMVQALSEFRQQFSKVSKSLEGTLRMRQWYKNPSLRKTVLDNGLSAHKISTAYTRLQYDLQGLVTGLDTSLNLPDYSLQIGLAYYHAQEFRCAVPYLRTALVHNNSKLASATKNQTATQTVINRCVDIEYGLAECYFRIKQFHAAKKHYRNAWHTSTEGGYTGNHTGKIFDQKIYLCERLGARDASVLKPSLDYFGKEK